MASTTMKQARQLLAATLDAPGEFWNAKDLVRPNAPEAQAGVNPQAFAPSEEEALKVAGHEVLAQGSAKESGLVPIRNLTGRNRRQIAKHMLALSERDRYLRFGYLARDEHVQKYVDSLDFRRDEVFGVFNRRLQLIAMAHLAFSRDPKDPSSAEFGVSVSTDARGKGLGTRLFERAVLHARSEGVDMIFIHALSENDAMLKIARKAGAVVENYGGEVQAHLRLPPQDLGDRLESAVRDAVEEGIGEVDFRLKQRALQFWQALAALQEVRQGLQNIGSDGGS
jgi:RimJ/RimL family protein N-acetyltransferase